MNETIQNYTKFELPLDAQWVDIDYMDTYEDFSYDHKDFGTLPDVVKELHAKKMHFVPILDAGIAKREGTDAYD